MRSLTFYLVSVFLISCATPVTYGWQDTRQPAREDSTADLEECQAYAAKQYRPGMPAGDPYLTDQHSQIFRTTDSNKSEWRPDRSPFPTTNINSQPIHEVPVDYTGYPGELDYYPNYLSDILEKCMSDKGWQYQPVTDDTQ